MTNELYASIGVLKTATVARIAKLHAQKLLVPSYDDLILALEFLDDLCAKIYRRRIEIIGGISEDVGFAAMANLEEPVTLTIAYLYAYIDTTTAD